MSPRKNKLHVIQKLRKKYKNEKEIGVLLHLVHASNNNVYEAAEDLVNVRKKYYESNLKLQDITAELEQLRTQVCRKKRDLKAYTFELEKSVKDLQSIDRNRLNAQETQILKLDSWLLEQDMLEAQKHVNYAEEDLKEIKSKKKSKNVTWNKDMCTLNSVSIPNVVTSGIVSLNGSVNINRNKCCICLEGKMNAVLYKCGHLCMCFSCASELMKLSENRKCPVCRTEILDVIKTYLA